MSFYYYRIIVGSTSGSLTVTFQEPLHTEYATLQNELAPEQLLYLKISVIIFVYCNYFFYIDCLLQWDWRLDINKYANICLLSVHVDHLDISFEMLC